MISGRDVIDAWNGRDASVPWSSGRFLAGRDAAWLWDLVVGMEPDAPEERLLPAFEVMAALWLLDERVAGIADPVLPDDQIEGVASTFRIVVSAYWLLVTHGIVDFEDPNVPLWREGGPRMRLAPDVVGVDERHGS